MHDRLAKQRLLFPIDLRLNDIAALYRPDYIYRVLLDNS